MYNNYTQLNFMSTNVLYIVYQVRYNNRDFKYGDSLLKFNGDTQFLYEPLYTNL